MIEVQARGGGEGPGVAAERAAALEAGLDALEFFFGERPIDELEPVAGDCDRPVGEKRLKLGIAAEPDVETAVGP